MTENGRYIIIVCMNDILILSFIELYYFSDINYCVKYRSAKCLILIIFANFTEQGIFILTNILILEKQKVENLLLQQ